jgi:hypothetical protein
MSRVYLSITPIEIDTIYPPFGRNAMELKRAD